MAVLGFCCAGLSLVSASRGSSLVVICRLLIAVASLLQSMGSGHVGSVVVSPGLLATGSVVRAHWTQLLCSMWDLPQPGVEPTSPDLTGRFFITEPARKPAF